MDSLTPLLSLFAFMLIPLWIPLAAITFGAIADVVRPRHATPVRRTAGARHAALAEPSAA